MATATDSPSSSSYVSWAEVAGAVAAMAAEATAAAGGSVGADPQPVALINQPGAKSPGGPLSAQRLVQEPSSGEEQEDEETLLTPAALGAAVGVVVGAAVGVN